MSNYTQSTNFATKDALSPGDPLKIVRGTEINTEFVNIAVAVATKFDTASLASPGPIGGTTPAAISGTTGTFSGNVQMASQNGGQLAGLRNKIINGNMTVLQRGTGSVTTNVAGTAFYVADRFFGATLATGAVVAAGNSTTPGASSAGGNSIYLQTSTAKVTLAAGDYSYLSQSIEGYNVANLRFGSAAAKQITISFRARADNIGSTAVITVALRNGATNRSYCTPVTITNVNASYSVTIPGDTAGTWLTDNGIGLRVSFANAAGSSSFASSDNAWVSSGAIASSTQTNFLGTATASLNITDVQLEIGPVATPFEQRPIGMELALCQRYYEVIHFPAQTSGNTSYGYFRATKRASPTMAYISGATGAGLAPTSLDSVAQGTYAASATNTVWSASSEL